MARRDRRSARTDETVAPGRLARMTGLISAFAGLVVAATALLTVINVIGRL